MAGELKAKIQQQMKDAMKARQTDRLAVLRMMLNEINSTQALKPDADELDAVTAYHKRLTKAQADFEKAGDPNALARLRAEIAIVAEFLPAQMADSELETLVETVVTEGNLTQRDFGKAMKEILARCGGAADGARVSAILKAKLAGK